jgi:fructose-1,6-bisphosphatase/inositol monophosphatase family enzyme
MGSIDDLQLAFDTSDLVAELALAHFESGVTATLKPDGTPVTEADQAVERLLRETLSDARPEDAFLGEELGQLGESDRVWILDPIDGTSFFSRGDPNWRIHVALEVQGTTEVALVTSPALRRCWWATRGGGSFESSWPREERNTRRLKVSTTSTLAHAVLDAWDDESRARLPRGRLAHRRARCRSSDSFVAKSMPSWLSAAISGITRRGFSLSRKPAAASPIEPVDVRAIGGAACARTPACTVSYSLRCTTGTSLTAGTGLSPGSFCIGPDSPPCALDRAFEDGLALTTSYSRRRCSGAGDVDSRALRRASSSACLIRSTTW